MSRFVWNTAGSPLILAATITPRGFTGASFGAMTLDGKGLAMGLRLEGAPGDKAATVKVRAALGGVDHGEKTGGAWPLDKPLPFRFERDAKGIRLTGPESAMLFEGAVPEMIEVRLACANGVYRFDDVQLGTPAPDAAPAR